MRIVHVSDLHFGAHSETLRSDFLSRLKKLKPDLLVCTGDLADQPDKGLLEEAARFLAEAETCCAPAATGAPRVMVVPGNHDYREAGWMGLHNSVYKRSFGDYKTEHFFPAAPDDPDSVNIWIFGFDSAQNGKVGGSGKIDEKELERFHSSYSARESKHPEAFKKAFKIVLVHHHPLPVNPKGDPRARWLTMTNAGQFLSAVLLREVHLVLHGHEHLQARTGFSSTLGTGSHSVNIISLGATLRTMKEGDRDNWFGLLTIDGQGARADFYRSKGDAWPDDPEDHPFVIRSAASALEDKWKHSYEREGFYYREVASMTLVDEDGDAHRIVECEDLTILDKKSNRGKGHVLSLPPTSGYLDRLRARGKEFTIGVDPPVDGSARIQSWKGNLVFEKQLGVKKPSSYQYEWHAVNSFALDKTQFNYRYGNDAKRLDNIEFTHFTVEDAIEDLTVIVQFPPDFEPSSSPRIRVARVDPDHANSREWEIDTDTEIELSEAHLLHYYDAMNVAALRVKRPRRGMSYGIQWEVPDGAPEPSDGTIVELRNIWNTRSLDTAQHSALLSGLGQTIVLARDFLMQGWKGPVDASLMYFDGQRSLRVLGAVLDNNRRDAGDRRQELVYQADLRYGDGIGGRAFKTNRLRVYVAPEFGGGADPNYYTTIPGAPVHQILVAFPVHKPESSFLENPTIYESKRPFGVLSLGSVSASCPLQTLRLPERDSAALQFQHEASTLIYKMARETFLGD